MQCIPNYGTPFELTPTPHTPPTTPLAPRTTTRPITSNALLLRVVTVINPFGQADPSGLSVIVIFILDFGKENHLAGGTTESESLQRVLALVWVHSFSSF